MASIPNGGVSLVMEDGTNTLLRKVIAETARCLIHPIIPLEQQPGIGLEANEQQEGRDPN
jgi:hypothetical protein